MRNTKLINATAACLIVWFAPTPRSCGGRSAVTAMIGSDDWSASTRAGTFLWARWSGRSNALAVVGNTWAPIRVLRVGDGQVLAAPALIVLPTRLRLTLLLFH